jgi:hypothetical protein
MSSAVAIEGGLEFNAEGGCNLPGGGGGRTSLYGGPAR